jgi:hypothetical protein
MPVWKATSNRASSRRPFHVRKSGAARRASTSGLVREPTSRRSWRLAGMTSLDHA